MNKNKSKITIPGNVVNEFQSILDTIAEIIDVPSALIMRVDEPKIEVFASSRSKNNPYHIGDSEHLSGLYCETVMQRDAELLVPNALNDPLWDHNPDIKLGMISYLGYPVHWPDGTIFGTICVLDSKENYYSDLYKKLIKSYRVFVEQLLGNFFNSEKLKKYNELLQNVNMELESFTQAVSHDLRNPLGTLKGYLDLLHKEYSGNLDEEGKVYIESSIELVGYINNMIIKLHKLNEISSAELNKEKINLSRIAKNILNELRNNEPDRKIELKIEDNITVTGDKDLLKGVMENLLSNSWKFTGNTENPYITFEKITINGDSFLCVRDNGVGFDEEESKNLFKIFSRLHSGKEFEGTGIGLYSAQKIINKHGGKIWAESRKEKGAAFYFTIP